jgi:hypothetical protein
MEREILEAFIIKAVYFAQSEEMEKILNAAYIIRQEIK